MTVLQISGSLFYIRLKFSREVGFYATFEKGFLGCMLGVLFLFCLSVSFGDCFIHFLPI
jgi:hypothetical protein